MRRGVPGAGALLKPPEHHNESFVYSVVLCRERRRLQLVRQRRSKPKARDEWLFCGFSVVCMVLVCIGDNPVPEPCFTVPGALIKRLTPEFIWTVYVV